MSEGRDYEEIVEKKIEEVKEAVEEGLDPESILQAEKENKNRTSLVEWLEERVEEVGEEASSMVSGDGVTLEAGSVADAAGDVASWKFAAGLVVGLILAFALFSSGVVGSGGGLSPAEAGDRIETYFSDNIEDTQLESFRVENTERIPGSSLYRVHMVLSVEFLNRTIEQNQTAIVDSNARYMFFAPPTIDTNQPLADQIGTTGQTPQQ